MGDVMIAVEKIKEGVVIDHIPAGKGISLLTLLGCSSHSKNVALLLNANSGEFGKKDILKISGRELSQEELSIVSLLAPCATVNIISHGEVVKKFRPELPDVLRVGSCPNPKCITKIEGAEEFLKEGNEYRCKYCERLFSPEELVSS